MSTFERGSERETLAKALAVLRSRWLILSGVVAVCVAVAVFRYERTTKSYVATASVAFQSGTLSDSALQVSTGGSPEPQREADTEVLIAHSPEVAQAVRLSVNPKASVAELLGQVQVETAPNANVLEFSASTADPEYSAKLANAFARQFIAFRAKTELSGIESAQSKLSQQINALPSGSAERATLEASVQRLGELRAVAGGGANVIGSASVPTSPTGTKLSTTIVIGVLLGLGIAFGIVFLLETLDRRLKTIEDLEAEYRLPALATIPYSSFRFRRASERTELLEPYRILRSALDFAAVTRQTDTLVVTSAVAGEGKTTVSVDLAHAIALAGRRIVLMELDLRRPTFAAHFRIDGSAGLTTALTAGTPVGDLLVEPFPDLPNFSVLPAGPLPQNPSELLGAPRISEMILELLEPEGMVLIDAPPLNPVADAQVLLNNSAVHAALIVARVDNTKREEIRRARSILDRHMVEPLGIVVTGAREAVPYGYDAYETPPAQSSRSTRAARSSNSHASGSRVRT
jgi:capsular exopolysaccharide synthesis family protein